jgi:hypothetical protein
VRRVLHRLLVLLILLCVGATAFVVVSDSGESDAGGPRVDVPDPRRVADRLLDRDRGASDAPRLRKARCRDGVPDCAAVRGRIVYVERVDPDGDGDLHVVVADGGISAPGLTSIDVRPGLRPDEDPSIGDLATAAGPVQRGSAGQGQIHALTFRVR